MFQIRPAQPTDKDALMRLYHILSSHYEDKPKALDEALSVTNTFIFVGELERNIVATATLSIRGVPSAGLVGYIDDVVTGPEFRGRGFGHSLIEYCLNQAREKNCIRAELTSRQSRETANRLYLKMGFKLRETNNYVLKF